MKSKEQVEYEQSVIDRHNAFQALLKAREEEAKARVEYDKACLQTRILWIKYKNMKGE